MYYEVGFGVILGFRGAKATRWGILDLGLSGFNQGLLNMPSQQTEATLSDSFYYSSITFTTLGYGDFTPIGFLRVVASFEALFGGMSIGFLVAGFANLKY